MSPYGRTLRSVCDNGGSAIVRTPSARDLALLEEMSFVRREAQAEADLAYEDWRQRLCANS